MADMLDDDSHFLPSHVVPNMVRHSGWQDFHSWACCQISETDKTLDLEDHEYPEWYNCDFAVVTVFRRTSRSLSTLLDARHDQDSLQASPTMETPIQWPVMADMFDDGSLLLPARVVPNMVKHSGWHDLHSWACCQRRATDKTLDLEDHEYPEWRDCDFAVVTVFRRASTAVCTPFDARNDQDSF